MVKKITRQYKITILQHDEKDDGTK